MIQIKVWSREGSRAEQLEKPPVAAAFATTDPTLHFLHSRLSVKRTVLWTGLTLATVIGLVTLVVFLGGEGIY